MDSVNVAYGKNDWSTLLKSVTNHQNSIKDMELKELSNYYVLKKNSFPWSLYGRGLHTNDNKLCLQVFTITTDKTVNK